MKRKTAIILGLVLGTALLATAAPKKGKPTSCAAWQDTFSTGQLDTSRWVVGSGQAPGYIAGQHIGYYDPGNVRLDGGLLTLSLQQINGTVDSNPQGVVSFGALIYTKAQCGYGSYEWTMKMSSTAICPVCVGTATSGSVSAGFLYTNNSETEIDYEFSGMNSDTLWLVNWLNSNPLSDPTAQNETYTGVTPFNSTDGFHTYKFVWSAGKISYYIDGVWQVDHTTNVPTAAAHFMINHWGTDSTLWGGTATIGATRNFFISRASYTPLP